MKVLNVMEQVVQDVIMKYKGELHLNCACERCLSDILAISLNHLSPHYIVNKDHSPYVRALHEIDGNGATQVLKTVANAATIVTKSPRCEFAHSYALKKEK